MAIYIAMWKVDETDGEVTYAFGPDDAEVGRVRLTKASGTIEVLDLPEDRREFYLSRVGRVLAHHHAGGDYPQNTCYSA